MFGMWPMERLAGEQAHAATKLGTAVAYKMAALYQENAQHATAAAVELDNTQRLIQRYVIGTDEDLNREPLAAPIEENPQRYYDFPYKLGAETWSTNYPIPAAPQFPAFPLNDYAQDRHDASALETGPIGFGLEAPDKSILQDLGEVTGMGPQSGASDSLMLLLRPLQLQKKSLRRSASLPTRMTRTRHAAHLTSKCSRTSTASASSRPVAMSKGPSKALQAGTGMRRLGGASRGHEFL